MAGVHNVPRSKLFIILTITAVYILSLNITKPVISIHANQLGLSPLLIGLLVSTYAIFPIVLSVQTGKWADRFGSKQMIYIGTTSFFAAVVLPSLFPYLATLFLSQALIGLAHNFMMIALQKAIGSAGENKDKSVASFSLTIAAGEFLGPLLGGFSFEYTSFRITFLIAAFIIVFNFVFNFYLTNQQTVQTAPKSGKQKTGSLHLLRRSTIRKAILVSGLAIYSKDLFVAYFPIYGSQIGLTPSQIGIVVSCAAAASIFVRLVQYPLIAKFTRGVVLLGSLALGGIAYVIIPFLDHFILLCMLSSVLGLGLGLGQPLSLVYILNSSPVGREGELLGLRLTFNRICQLAAPSLFGLLGGALGIAPIFWTSGILLVSGALYSRENERDREEMGNLEA